METTNNAKGTAVVRGLCSYYRKFIKDFAKIIHPLTQLMSTDKGKVSKFKSKHIQIKWTRECGEAMWILKEKLTSAPILAIPRFNEPFIVETDASNKGLGAVLSQKYNGVKRVVAYASRALSKK